MRDAAARILALEALPPGACLLIEQLLSGVEVLISATRAGVVPALVIGLGGVWAEALGDVVVIPAGTGHWFTKIDDHIDYLMVRIDPDKVTPLKDETASKAYLSKPARSGGQ